jgi:hypothetical protein
MNEKLVVLLADLRPRRLPRLRTLSRTAFRLSRLVAVLFIGLNAFAAVHAQSVIPVSISPSSGSGSMQAFNATYTDPNSAMDIRSVSLFIMNGIAPDSESGWSANECILNATISSGVIRLVQDPGGAFLSNTAIAGTDQTVSNSQCTVLASLSTVTISGNSVTVKLFVTFTTAFRGAKQLYLSAENQNDDDNVSVLTQVGTYNITASVSPLVVFPSSGSGSEQTFTAIYSDTTNPIEFAVLNLKSSGNNTNAANACKMRYDLDTTDISLVNDAGTAYGSPITSGSPTPLSNRQCTVYGVGTSATTFGNYVVIYFDVSFAAGFDGEKEMTMGGQDKAGAYSFSNRAVGTYTVTAPPPTTAPAFTLANTAVSVVPVGASASSTITVTPRGGFIGSVALTCTVIGPAMAVFPPTCAIAAPTTISVTAETTATLVVNTTPASTAAVNNPLQQFFVAAASVTMAALLLPVLPLRCRWQTLLSLLVLALIVGAAGCGAINSQVIAPTNPGATNRGTTTGDYIVAVTGANGAITATTAVGVTVK